MIEETLSDKIQESETGWGEILEPKDVRFHVRRVMEGCGKEACGVTVTDEQGMPDCDIHLCGEMCYHHKEVHYCRNCEPFIEKLKKEFGEKLT